MVATKETIIAFLDEEVYSKIFCSAKQQTNFISRSLEKILSNGVNKVITIFLFVLLIFFRGKFGLWADISKKKS